MQGTEHGRWHDLATNYRARLSVWQAEDPCHLVEGWSLTGLWTLTSETTHRVAPQTVAFVTEWAAIKQRRHNIADDPDARALILRRETRLKGPKARLTNDAALARWGGASGAGVLNFRWTVVQRHLRDLADAV